MGTPEDGGSFCHPASNSIPGNKWDRPALSHIPCLGPVSAAREWDPDWLDLGDVCMPEARESEVLFSRPFWFRAGQAAIVTRRSGKV